MMKTLLSLLVLAFIGSAAGADNMKAFPPAETGMTRYVISLPSQTNESSFRVEVIVGKTVKTDAQNQYFFGGKLETENITGWDLSATSCASSVP